MTKISKKMPITITLLVFSYLIAACGIGVGSLGMIFKFKDTGCFIYGFLILAGSLLLAALIRMFADIGQIVFDIRIDMQNSFRQVNELDRELNRDLKTQLQLQADTLNQKLGQSSAETRKLDQELNRDLKTQLQLQADTLNKNLEAIIQKFDRSSHEAQELSQKLAEIKDNFNQMNCDSKDMNQNLHQIRTFFEQIERHLDLKK
jgi:methyl-accepting chemotaxis protein